mgnify:CR=1 FL=1
MRALPNAAASVERWKIDKLEANWAITNEVVAERSTTESLPRQEYAVCNEHEKRLFGSTTAEHGLRQDGA